MVELEKLLHEIKKIEACPMERMASGPYVCVHYLPQGPELKALGKALQRAPSEELGGLIRDLVEVLMYGEKEEIKQVVGEEVCERLGHYLRISYGEPARGKKERNWAVMRIWHGIPGVVNLDNVHFDSGRGKGALLHFEGNYKEVGEVYGQISAIPGIILPPLDKEFVPKYVIPGIILPPPGKEFMPEYRIEELNNEGINYNKKFFLDPEKDVPIIGASPWSLLNSGGRVVYEAIQRHPNGWDCSL